MKNFFPVLIGFGDEVRSAITARGTRGGETGRETGRRAAASKCMYLWQRCSWGGQRHQRYRSAHVDLDPEAKPLDLVERL